MGKRLLPLRYLRASLKTERPLRQTGLEVQDFLGDPKDAGASLRRLFGRIENLHAGPIAPEEQTDLQDILLTALRNGKPTPEQREQRRATVTQGLRRVQAQTDNSRSSVLVERALENALWLEELSSYDAKTGASDPPKRSLYRDRRMGEALSWLLNHYYTGKRLIVLVGGGHAHTESVRFMPRRRRAPSLRIAGSEITSMRNSAGAFTQSGSRPLKVSSVRHSVRPGR